MPSAIHRPHGDRDGIFPHPGLQKWAVAMYYVLTARKGISSLQLSDYEPTPEELEQVYRVESSPSQQDE